MNSLYTQKLYASSNTTITDGGKNGHYTEARAYNTQTYGDVMVNINKTFGDDWSLNANIGARSTTSKPMSCRTAARSRRTDFRRLQRL